MRSVGFVFAFCVAAIVVAPRAHAQAPGPAPASNSAAAAARDLWLGDEGRYVRQWQLLGPLRATQADEIARLGVDAKNADPASEQRFADQSVAAWRTQGTYGDILDGFSGMTDGDAGFARVTVDRAAAGEQRQAPKSADELSPTLHSMAERLAKDHHKRFKLTISGFSDVPSAYVTTIKDCVIQMLRNSQRTDVARQMRRRP